MATMRPLVALALVVSVGGCDDLQGFSGEVTPLATVRFVVDGDFEAVRFPEAGNTSLHAALVWGAQWLPDPICVLPSESNEVDAVLAAGCRDSFGFVPRRSDESVPIELGVPASIDIMQLPSAEALVGDVTSRIAYASIIVYDDRDRSGRFELGRSRDDLDDTQHSILGNDIVYGASFVSMTEPDVRLVLREGEYNDRFAFYPRVGCGVPERGFSIAAAGGFTKEAALAAVIVGELPKQDPATCSETPTETTLVEIPLRAPREIMETGCRGRQSDSSVEYLEPPVEPIDMTNRVAACAKIPDFGTGENAGITQLILSSRSEERCKNVLHFVLKGCEDDLKCAQPEWDFTANPPAWWPCAP